MSTPLVVVIPTRRRLATFRWALETVLSQDYDDFKVVALVNSCPETVQYLKDLNDARVQVEASSDDLPMWANWERMFDAGIDPQAHVFVLGDDDGLLPGALACADRLIRRYRIDVLNWRKGEYGWPDIVRRHMKNYAKVHLGRDRQWWSSDQFLENARGLKVPYHFGPGLYSSFVKMDLLLGIRRATGNRFFHSAAPDVYSCYAVAAVQDFYLRCGFALSINGSSGYGTGANVFFSRTSDIARQFQESSPLYPSLSYGPSVHVMEADSLLRLGAALPHLADRLQLDYQALADALAAEALREADADKRDAIVLATEDICSRNGIAPPPSLRGGKPEITAAPSLESLSGFHAASASLMLDLGKIGVVNIMAACEAIGMLNPLSQVS